MSFYKLQPRLPRSFRLILASFLQHDSLPFANVLPEHAIEQAFRDQDALFAEEEESIYTPAITLWAFLSQVLFKDEQRSCVAAVARIGILLVALERGPCSGNTGAYCRARGKLSQEVIRQLATDVAQGCEDQLDEERLWHGRHVYLADGTTVSMPDTVDNQEAYPQNPQQKAGLGFPIARLVALLSFTTGMVTGMAMAPYSGKETGESALLRSQIRCLKKGDVVVADQYYCSYFMIALLREHGVDLVARMHGRRKDDYRSARRLGRNDHVLTWDRPQRPKWMDEQTYERMPSRIQVRAIRVHVAQPGFRVESFVAATTLTDSKKYAAEEIAHLYRCRWTAELDIRAIKITMGMDILRCKTPEMVRKEIWTCLLAYNLIRRSMLQSAEAAGVSPRALSFTAAMQSIAAGWLIAALSDDRIAAALIDAALKRTAEHRVGYRPGRVEPRAIKRRPKEHALLTKPRRQARAELMAKK